MTEITRKGSESKPETIAVCGMNLLPTSWTPHASFHLCEETTTETGKKVKEEGEKGWNSSYM